MKTLEGDMASSQQVIGDVSKLVSEAHPMLSAKVIGDNEVAIRQKKAKRLVPLTDAKLNKYLDIAFCPIRGVKNAMRAFKVSVRLVHLASMSSAMTIIKVQICTLGIIWARHN